jgi:hypothetical protein
MADIRRLVTLSTGGRPVTVLDFEASSTYYAERDSFTYEPGEANTQSSREPGRYGGSLVVDEAQANGTVRWRAQIKGTTGDQVAQRTEALIAAINNDAPDQLLAVAPGRGELQQLLPDRRPGTLDPPVPLGALP